MYSLADIQPHSRFCTHSLRPGSYRNLGKHSQPSETGPGAGRAGRGSSQDGIVIVLAGLYFMFAPQVTRERQ